MVGDHLANQFDALYSDRMCPVLQELKQGLIDFLGHKGEGTVLNQVAQNGDGLAADAPLAISDHFLEYRHH